MAIARRRLAPATRSVDRRRSHRSRAPYTRAAATLRSEPSFRDEAVRVLREEGLDAAWYRYWAHLFAPDADPNTVGRSQSIARGIDVEHHVNGVCAFHNRADRAALLAELDVPVTIVRG